MKYHGITLLELLIALVIVVILASFGIASYTNYITQSRMTNLLGGLDNLRQRTNTYYLKRGRLPDSLADLRLQTGDFNSTDVSSTVLCNSCDAKYGNSFYMGFIGTNTLVPDVDAPELMLKFIPDDNLLLNWACVSNNVPADYLPGSCQRE